MTTGRHRCRSAVTIAATAERDVERFREYMSGYARPDTSEIADSGAGSLQKPFSEEELTLKVREILDS